MALLAAVAVSGCAARPPTDAGEGDALFESVPLVRRRAPGVDHAPDAPFVATPHDVVARMLEAASVKRQDVVVDLGSGDGRIVIAAARRYGCRAVGYEIDMKLVEQSRRTVRDNKLDGLVRIEHCDIFAVALSDADVVAMFLYPGLMHELLPQLQRMKSGSRIVSHEFTFPDIPPEKVIELRSSEDDAVHRVYLWTLPFPKPAD